MLAIVDGVPRTLRLDQMIRHYVPTRSRSSSGGPSTGCARRRSAPTSCAVYVKALDMLDEVIALIRRSPSATRPGPA